MKLWIDDIRPAPEGYIWAHSTNEAIALIKGFSYIKDVVEVIDIDHDAGVYAADGGDYIRVLDFLESCALSIPIHIHSMNPVGVSNMRRIIERNGWREIR